VDITASSSREKHAPGLTASHNQKCQVVTDGDSDRDGSTSEYSSDSDDSSLLNDFSHEFGGCGGAYDKDDDELHEMKKRRVSQLTGLSTSIVSRGSFTPVPTRLPGMQFIDPLVTRIMSERCPPDGVQAVSADVVGCITVALKEHIARVVECAVEQRIVKVCTVSFVFVR
jgi:hypothetical protein